MALVSTVANVFAAVGTVLAVALALFLQVILVQRRRPRLYLDFSSDDEDQDISTMHDEKGNLNLWLQMKVRSLPGKNTARNVRVTLLRVIRPTGVHRPAVPSRILKWSDSPDPATEIPSGIWKRVDVLHYWVEKKDAKRSLLLPAFNQNFVARFPPSPRHYLVDAGQYIFEVTISVDDIDAAAWWISFTFDPQPVLTLKDLREQITDFKWGPAKIGDGGRFIY